MASGVMDLNDRAVATGDVGDPRVNARPMNDAAAEKARRKEASLPSGVEPFTDLANAHRVRLMHGSDLLFTSALGWLAYDGARFEADATGAASRRMHDVAQSLAEQAAQTEILANRATGEERKRLQAEAEQRRAWARKTQQEPRIRAGLSIASTLEGIATTPEAFDRDLMLLACRNGTLDLRTGKLRPHRRDDLVTRVSPLEYDPAAECPLWLAFLGSIFKDREELIAFVRRAIGYSLTGCTAEQCFFICHGGGANGKTTLIEVVRYVLGDYALTTSTDTFLRTGDRRGPENDVARLRGARFVSAVESGEGRRLDEERVKRLTGGDTVTARLLYKEPFEFSPQFKLWMGVNDRPEIQGVDHGIWRRVRLIPFDVTIAPEEQDPELAAKLRAEGPGILRWAVQGCLEWQAQGLNPPPAVLVATEDWRGEANAVARFVDEGCVRAERLKTKAAKLYTAFCDWCREQGEEPVSQQAFGRRLTALGFRQERTKQARQWSGLVPRTDDEDPRGGDG